MPSPKKRLEPPVHFKGVIVFFLLVLCFCFFAFYYVRPPSKPPKLEKPDTPGKPIVPQITETPQVLDYGSSCQEANQLIRRYWRKQGISEKNFRILSQESFQETDKRWVFTEAKVLLPKGVDAFQAARNLAQELKNISPPFVFQVDRREENRFYASIKVDDVVTHSLLLAPAPPQLAVIIDDIGGNIETTRKFLGLGIPLTLSILPGLPYSKESEDLAHQYGYEVMLHLPMEPKNLTDNRLGNDAITTEMGDSEIREMVTSHLSAFTYIKGVNNHMGSRATESEQVMQSVLNVLKPRGLYFVDSRTSSQSVAHRTAQAMEIPSAKNELFIDNEPEVDYCKDFIDRAIRRAKAEGSGIVIGHPRETTLHALEEMTSRIEEEGISLVFVSDIVL